MKFYILLLCLSPLLLGCGFYERSTSVVGNGILSETHFTLAPFSRIQTDGVADVHLVQGSQFGARLEGDENLLREVSLQVKNGVLFVSDNKRLRPKKLLTVTVTAPVLESVTLNGAGDIIASSPFVCKGDLSLTLNGTGDLRCATIARSIAIYEEGTGDVRLAGSGENVKIEANGTGNIDVSKLQVKFAHVDLQGTGDVSVNATGRINISLSGTGNVYYKGSAAVSEDNSGTGRIERMQK